jgi:threonine aldolase
MILDLSSDNVTQPTGEMREAMRRAEILGFGVPEDRNIARLEVYAADITGKEAAILMPTGTQANLVAILCQTEPHQEVIVGPDSHIYEQELGGAGAIAGVMIKTWANPGIPSARILQDTVQPSYRFPTIASPTPALVCLENSHNASGGTVISAEKMRGLCEIIRGVVPRIHLDGARIFNAAASMQTPVRELLTGEDTAMFSLDKCLSAPFGAMLCGSAETIALARRLRRMLGGYTRKIGILAAAGLVAMEQMTLRTAEDNNRAASLGARLNALDGLIVDPYPIPTNLIMINLSELGLQPQRFVDRLKKDYGIASHIYGRYIVRFAIHRHIGPDEENRIVLAVEELLKTMESD